MFVEGTDRCAPCFDELGQKGKQALHAIPEFRFAHPRLHTHSTLPADVLPPVDGNRATPA
ncbi:hypothetical protein RAJCM14343_2059 [Rhodococcus aetherivorans]|uniref:Uncharacterized protein n=1 Tax=Rhodococcus aetherivorans TaxID=191292 RepID=A0ABQ0YJR3_9NOCA|nr:hypothetical protein RAJCM14343_2059 [Rhodococcus aetherivorans]